MSGGYEVRTLRVAGRNNWAVFNAVGRRVSPLFWIFELAEIRADKMNAPVAVERPCITCSTTFKSTGPGHRMCHLCRAGSRLDAQTLSPVGVVA